MPPTCPCCNQAWPVNLPPMEHVEETLIANREQWSMGEDLDGQIIIYTGMRDNPNSGSGDFELILFESE